MARNSKRARERRKSVLQSLEKRPKGGVTTHGARLMAEGLGGTPTLCTITHHCRTSVFEFPGCYLKSRVTDVHDVIFD